MSMGRTERSTSRREIVGWLPSVGVMLLGAAISQDVEMHLLAGTILIACAALVIVIVYRLDRKERPGA